MYGTTPETVLFTALALLGVRSTLLGDATGPEVAYARLKAERGFLLPEHAFLPMDEIGAFIGDLYARERQRLPDAPDRILTLKVDFRDEDAAAEITPEMAAAYLSARGWKREDIPDWTGWHLRGYEAWVPTRSEWGDYGRRMVTIIGAIAAAEARSPLAVWAEMIKNNG